MCAQLYILPARELRRRRLRRLAKVNLRLIPILIISLPAHRRRRRRVPHFLWRRADDKMCPRGFETFSLRERTRERCLPARAAERNQRDNKSAASSSAAADNFQRRALRNF